MRYALSLLSHDGQQLSSVKTSNVFYHYEDILTTMVDQMDCAPEIWNQHRTVNVDSWIKCLVGVYEEYRHIITQKGNTITIN